MNKKKIVSYELKKRKSGYIFIAPWLIGFILLFLIPFITTIAYSFCSIKIDVGRLVLNPIGFGNYYRAFFKDSGFLPNFTASLKNLIQVPFIVMLSFFIAVLLNQKFHGRVIARAIFFLPVIMMSGPVRGILNIDPFFLAISGGDRVSALAEFTSAQELLNILGIDNVMSTFIVNITSELFNLVWSSGIQILIFLSGLQSIPKSHYEVADVEGATSWEKFWKITFPSVAPMTMVNIIYTMIDNLLGTSSSMLSKIQHEIHQVEYSYAAALSLISFVVWVIIIVIVYKIVDRYVNYLSE